MKITSSKKRLKKINVASGMSVTADMIPVDDKSDPNLTTSKRKIKQQKL